MKIVVDTEAATLQVEGGGAPRALPLYSPDAFAVLSELWTKVGWSQRYSYGFSWLGRPIVQLPEDLVRMQEVVWRVRPDVVIETGVAHGGSLVFYAGLLQLMGGGRVIGVDIEIRPHNRAAIEEHPLASSITLIEGSSIDPSTVARVAALVPTGARVLVVLDSNHTRAHVAAELEAYAPFVTADSYLVATDGIMGALHDVPGGQPGWATDNPEAAARDFASRRTDFVLERPTPPFDESRCTSTPTYWPGAWLRRVAR